MQNYLKLTIHRLNALADGIFAIAMTLLAVTIDLPKKEMELSREGLHSFLMKQSGEIISYMVSFVLLAIFWLMHHQQFHFIEHTDRKHLWINMMIFMCITLVPFSTSLAGDFPSDLITQIYFHSNMFVTGLLFYLNWAYSTRNKRLVSGDLSDAIITIEKRRLIVVPFSAFMAIIISFFSPKFSPVPYILIPIMLSLKKFNTDI